MKYLRIYGAVVVAMAIVSALFVAMPAMAGSDNNVGKHAYKINIIGRPNDWQGSDMGSDSKTIFISIKTEPLATCEDKSGVTLKGEVVSVLPEQGQRIYFYLGPVFEVVDRDASDGVGMVTIPYAPNGYDIYIRILGGSNKNFPGCLDADAYYYNHTSIAWYWIGHLDANRKPGTPEKISVRSLFYNGNVAYFDEHWQDYFWNILNNGLRNMQLIFYEV